MKKPPITPLMPSSPRSLVLLVVLVILGCLGNHFVLPLFFGADFIFGSIAVFIVLNFYGLGWGLLAALLIHSLTYFLWGHLYSFLIFMLETLFVGYFLRSRRQNLVLLDGLFWLVAGMPLAYVFLAIMLHLGPLNGLFIMLKEGVNGVFNALVASLAINHLPWEKFLQPGPSRRTTSLRLTLSNLLVAMILVPALFIMLLNSRHEVKDRENDTIREMQSVGGFIVNDLSFWYRQNLLTLTALADLAAKTPLAASPALQSATETIDKANASFRAIYVGDAQGTSITFSPARDGQGHSLGGRNYADRPYFKEMQATKRPVLSAVYIGRAIPSPTVSLSVPILQGERLRGYVSGSLDLSHLQGAMKSFLDKYRHLEITLVDSQGNVITSTQSNRQPLMPWRRQGGTAYQARASVYRWFPGDKTQPTLARWKNAVYVGEYPVPDLPWKVVVEASMAPLQRSLYLIYMRNLAIMAGLIILVLPLAELCGRWVVRPLAGLAQVTGDLPEDLGSQQDIVWPVSSISEINDLVVNFQAMARTLRKYFQGLQEANAGMAAEIAERVRVEAALRDSEAQYRLLADNARDVIWMMDQNLHLTYISPSVQLLTGYSVEECMIREMMQQMLTPASLQSVLDKHAQVLKIERRERPDLPPSATLELEFSHKEGRTIWLEINYTLLRDTQGHHIGFVGVTRDITARKRAEEALRKQMQFTETLLETIPSPVFYKDASGKYLGCNRAFEKFWGKSREEVIDKTVYDIGPKEIADKYAEMDQELFESPGSQMYEWKGMAADGLVKDVVFYKASLLDNNGKVDGLVGVVLDITARKQTEEALRRSEREKDILNRISMVFLTIPDEKMYAAVLEIVLEAMESKFGVFGFMADNGDLVVPSMSRGGWSACQVPDKSIIFPAATWGHNIWGKAIRERQSFYSEGPFNIPEGHIHIDNFLNTPIVFGNKTIGLLSVANRTRNYEAARQQLARELHDQICQNLASINISLETIMIRAQRESLDQLLSRIADIGATTEQTGEIARNIMESLRPTVLDHYGLMGGLRQLGGQFSQRTAIDLKVYGEDADLRLKSEVELALFRIAQEALNNVAKHAQASKVVLTKEVGQDIVRLVIFDNGIGFDQNAAAHPQNGRGWGLTTMTERARFIGGRCRIESQPGKGTKVVVEVPRN